jgi:hypothetical protein
MLILLVLRRLKIKNTYLAGVLLQEFKMKKINCIKQQIEDNIYVIGNSIVLILMIFLSIYFIIKLNILFAIKLVFIIFIIIFDMYFEERVISKLVNTVIDKLIK